MQQVHGQLTPLLSFVQTIWCQCSDVAQIITGVRGPEANVGHWNNCADTHDPQKPT